MAIGTWVIPDSLIPTIRLNGTMMPRNGAELKHSSQCLLRERFHGPLWPLYQFAGFTKGNTHHSSGRAKLRDVRGNNSSSHRQQDFKKTMDRCLGRCQTRDTCRVVKSRSNSTHGHHRIVRPLNCSSDPTVAAKCAEPATIEAIAVDMPPIGAEADD